MTLAPLVAAATLLFGPPATVATISGADLGSATENAVGDLNGDAIPDLVVTRITYPPAHVTHPIGILLGDGKGGFTDGSSLWDGPPPRTEWGRQIVIADLNGDGRNDIFVADHGYDADPFPGHQNALALSTPQGKLVDATSNLPPESGFSHSATAADVNGDGSIDLYVGNLCCGDGTPPEILLNDGKGHFTRRIDLLPDELQNPNAGRYTRSLFLDVNGDRAPDLVLLAEDHTPASRILLNDGTGHFHFAPQPLPPKPFGANAIGIAIAPLDVNGDGKPDLIAGYTRGDPFYQGRHIQVLVNDGNGAFRDETTTRLPQQDDGPSWPYAIRVADFNGDGRLDFAVDANSGPTPNDPSSIDVDDGTGVYRPQAFQPASWLWAPIDVNRDGRPDIVSVEAGAPESYVAQLQVTTPTAPTGLRARRQAKGIALSWTATPGATGYEVSRSGKRLAAPTATSFLDRTAKRGRTYVYTVRAANDAGQGPFSAPVRIRR